MAHQLELAGIETFEQAKLAFRSAFYEAAQRRDLPAFADLCQETLATTASSLVRPYAFAYAARSLLHQRASYATGHDGRARPLAEVAERLDALLRTPAAINERDNYFHEVVAGLRDYVVTGLEPACLSFARAARFQDYFRVVRDDFGGGAAFGKTFPLPEDLQAERPAVAPVDMQEDVAPRLPWRLALSSHADSLYAEAFFPAWIEQLGALGVHDLLLHLHIIFRQQREPELLASLADKAAAQGVNLMITSEQQGARDKAYFACSRFLRARGLMDRFRCNTVFVDADAFIVDPDAFRDTHLPKLMAEQRVTGMIAPVFAEGYLPWRRFSAGWLVVPYNEAGLAFAGLVGQCIGYFWDARFGRNWWIDQFGLESARHIMSRRPEHAASFSSWPASYPSSIAAVGERNKMTRVAETGTMRRMMSTGLTYHQAMIRLNRGA